MSEELRLSARLAAALVVAAVLGSPARAQTAAVSAEPMIMFDPSMQPVIVDPLAAQMMMGTAVPMTRAQAGLAAASSAQRLTGIGSGRISGVRGSADSRTGSGRRPTLGAPGGQASSFFNRYGRGTATNVSAPVSQATTRNYYNRPAGFFPEGRR